MVSLKQIRRDIIELLKESGNDNPQCDADVIIMHALGINKTDLIIGEKTLTSAEYERISGYTQRLCKGEPVQYIVGGCEFMSLWFDVDSSVLIPRSDTETLTESVIEQLRDLKEAKVADIGCGSGCIGISLAYYLKNIKVYAFDISEDALEIAKSNAEKNNVSDRMEFIHCDIMKDELPFEFDCIVSNPPYIPCDMIKDLDTKVRDYEPVRALLGGRTGLEFYNRIAQKALLKPNGLLAFEIGYDQGSAVKRIVEQNAYKDIKIIKDIENRDRAVLAWRR